MTDPADTDDSRQRVFADMLRAFSAEGGAAGLPLLALTRPFFEAQRTFLGWYQRALEEESSTHALEEQARPLARGFLAAYLQFVQAQREHRHTLMQAQCELLKTYLAMVDEVLGRVDDGKT